jgi:outer membrane protein assembly factor BamC
MLKRLLVKFGLDATKAAEAIANSTPEAKAASKQGADAAASSSAAKNAATVQARADGAPVLNVQDSFDRAWRRIGIAIDKAGLITQDQNRDQGVFFVQYSAEKMKGPDAFNPESKGISGFFDSITNLFSSSDTAKGADAAKIKFADKSNYRVTVAKKGDSLSEVSVSDKDGKKLPDDQARRFLEILSVQPF